MTIHNSLPTSGRVNAGLHKTTSHPLGDRVVMSSFLP